MKKPRLRGTLPSALAQEVAIVDTAQTSSDVVRSILCARLENMLKNESVTQSLLRWGLGVEGKVYPVL